jgi:hypothetical protein
MAVIITGSNTPTAGGVTYGDGSTYAVTAAGTSGQVLQSNGASAPSWVTASSSALVFISSATASNSASITFTGLSSTYDVYMVEIINAVASTNAYLYLRSSSNNGSSYDSSGYMYTSIGSQSSNGNTNNDSSYGTTSFVNVTNNGGPISTTASEGGMSGFVHVMHPAASNYTFFKVSETHYGGSGQITGFGAGVRTSTTPVNAIQFYFSSGNIASGTFRLYGISNS